VNFIDTHCHIHEAVRRTTPVYDKWHEKGDIDPDELIVAAREDRVTKLICVGTTVADSELAIEFVKDRESCWASIGIHPHEAKEHLSDEKKRMFERLASEDKVVAIGECGLDYFYMHSPKEAQIEILKFQMELARKHNLPMIFHVREAFDDFWPILESYDGIRGVLHSFTDTKENLERAVKHGLSIGVNGIATFTKNAEQLNMYRAIPSKNLLLETDAPFLTPAPYRGKINEPKYTRVTAEFLARLRQENLEQIAKSSTGNAELLFGV
jgi:TatD DNase family protein